jgi:hypothetical protein
MAKEKIESAEIFCSVINVAEKHDVIARVSSFDQFFKLTSLFSFAYHKNIKSGLTLQKFSRALIA